MRIPTKAGPPSRRYWQSASIAPSLRAHWNGFGACAMMRKLLLALAALLLLPALASAAGPDLKPGDVFVYKAGSRAYTQSYIGPGPDGGFLFRDNTGGQVAFDASMSLTAMPGSRIEPDNGQLAVDPKHGFKVGKSWTVSYQTIHDDGSTLSKTRSCTISAHEPKLIVHAGTFNAYRVDCTIEGGNGAPVYGESWYDARSWRALKHSVGQKGGTLQKVLELIAFERQPG
jgi:hypothetical protein